MDARQTPRRRHLNHPGIPVLTTARRGIIPKMEALIPKALEALLFSTKNIWFSEAKMAL